MPDKPLMRRILREPLFHFLVIGAALFFGDILLSSGETEGATEVVYVGADDIERLKSVYVERYGRPPTPDELGGLVEDFIREEILYREALSMGLDQNDTIVRRRLAQKLAFASSGLDPSTTPDDETLREWYEANLDRYRTPARFDFAQIFFDPDRRDTAEADAEQILAELHRNETESPGRRGDFQRFRAQYRDATSGDVAAEFGATFVQALEQLPAGTWHGPIQSDHGVHLVRISEREEGAAVPFEEMRAVAESDWLAEQQAKVDEAFYANIRENYRVVLDTAAEALVEQAGE